MCAPLMDYTLWKMHQNMTLSFLLFFQIIVNAKHISKWGAENKGDASELNAQKNVALEWMHTFMLCYAKRRRT